MKNEDVMWDAKLSAAQRKKLKGSTFCGPGRSFPVPDCAHVTAAKRLIGRYKGSATTKAKILACVNRKAKQLGCGGAKDSDEVIENIINSEEYDMTHEVLAFMESMEEDMTAEEQSLLDVKVSAANLLDTLRRGRIKITKDRAEMIDIYMARTLQSLLDAVSDEIELIQDTQEK